MKKLFTAFFAVAAIAFAASCGGNKEANATADFDGIITKLTTLAEKAEAAESQEAKDSLNAEFEAMGEEIAAFEGTLTEEQQQALDQLNERFWNAYNQVALPVEEAAEAAEEATEEATEEPVKE